MTAATGLAATPYRQQSTAGIEQLVMDHTDLVRRLAWHVRGRANAGHDLADLMQAGMVALVEAARNYQDMGFSFTTYATTRVRGAMIDFVRRQSTLTRSAITFRRAADQARQRLETSLGRPPTDHEMATALAMAPEAYRRNALEAQDIRIESIDDSYSDCLAVFALDEDAIEDRIDSQSQAAALARALESLPHREATILQLYFLEEMNLQEIGEVLGVGAARICQIKKAALERLRRLMEGGGNPAKA